MPPHKLTLHCGVSKVRQLIRAFQRAFMSSDRLQVDTRLLFAANITERPKRQRQRKKKAAPGTDEVGNGMKLVAPPAEPSTHTATLPAAARSSRARWQMQGFCSSEQVLQPL